MASSKGNLEFVLDQTARRLLPDAAREKPYPGAKEMLLVEEVDEQHRCK